MRLNLGCGFNKLEGHLNVDREASCSPDQVVDLESFPWPWADNTFSEVMAFHTLEHLGQTPEKFIRIIQELWRVCKPDAAVRIAVPHPRHENFTHDPTHVRAITPITIAMFDQVRNIQDAEAGGQETKLGLFAGVDLEIKDLAHDLDEPWHSKLLSGELKREDIELALRIHNNVCYQIRMVVRMVKPPRGEQWLKSRSTHVSP